MTLREVLQRLRVSCTEVAQRARLRELLAWCLPALFAGLILRAALTAALPYGYYHADTPDFLTTPDRLLFNHHFELHSKKTFLVPAFFTLPFLLGVPALIAIPLLQHLLGLVMVLMIGALSRLWFVHWKWFIVPLTLVIACDPALLWFEHTLMAETLFVFCTTLLALIGTLYVHTPTTARFRLLCVALVLEAGARPEGKLLFGFALLLLVLVHFGAWRQNVARFAALIVLGIVTHFLTKTSQGGLLLYTSVARLTPAPLTSAPGFDTYIADERATLAQRWEQQRLFPKVADRRLIATAAEKYLDDQHVPMLPKRTRSVDNLCMKLAAETCRRAFLSLPEHVYWKFRFAANEPPNGLLDSQSLFDFQQRAFDDAPDRGLRLSRGLSGRTMKGSEDWSAFLAEHDHPVDWFNRLNARWFAAANTIRFPEMVFPAPTPNQFSVIYRGIPLYFLLAGAGLVAIALRRGPLQRFHVAWGLALAAFFFTIILTANVKPRFRFVFEPFWFIYLALLFESVVVGLASLGRRVTSRLSSPA